MIDERTSSTRSATRTGGFADCVLCLSASALACLRAGCRAQEGPGDSSAASRLVQSWEDQPDWVTSLAFLKDGRHLCVGTYEEILLRDARGSDAARTLPLAPGYVKARRSRRTANGLPPAITRR